MSAAGKWDDLALRFGSAALLIAIAVLGIWAGGPVWHGLVALVCAAMVWELVRMVAPERPRLALGLGALSGTALLAASYAPPGIGLPLLFVPAFVGFAQLRGLRKRCVTYATAALLAGFAMIALRDDFGVVWMVWLVVVVVVTDVAGYFAGRMIGGPKFWPQVSPKKTWSGTVAGWIAAGLVGLGFMLWTNAGPNVVGISVALSMAAQMGDIAESAMKRKVGIKDSSALIPGHGGLLDRFDGMLGAALLLLLVEALMAFPPVAV